MLCEDTIHGTLCQYDRPDWKPLVDLVGTDLADWFMWMCEIELADGSRAHAYKHVSTRRYFHLAVDGRAFAYTADDRYREIHPRDAIDEAFAGWERVFPPATDPDAVRVALTRCTTAAIMRQDRALADRLKRAP